MAPLGQPIHKSPALLRTSLILAAASVLFFAGCGQTWKVSDPQLKPIEEMLEANLPARSPQDAVSQFLETRGYATEPSGKPGTIVAIVRDRETNKPQPVTARVTFYFDANGKLNTYEIVQTVNPSTPE